MSGRLERKDREHYKNSINIIPGFIGTYKLIQGVNQKCLSYLCDLTFLLLLEFLVHLILINMGNLATLKHIYVISS